MSRCRLVDVIVEAGRSCTCFDFNSGVWATSRRFSFILLLRVVFCCFEPVEQRAGPGCLDSRRCAIAGPFAAAASCIAAIAACKADLIGRRNELDGDGDGAQESEYQDIWQKGDAVSGQAAGGDPGAVGSILESNRRR